MISIGVDLGIRKAAYSLWIDGELAHTAAYEVEPSTRAVELMLVSNWLEDEVQSHLVTLYQTNIFVEMPLIGNNRKYSLQIAMMYGACLARMAWMEENGRVRIFGVNVSEWKKEVVGAGNAGKDDVTKHITALNSSYPSICGHDQDRIDAACIGLYGVRVTARADELRS